MQINKLLYVILLLFNFTFLGYASGNEKKQFISKEQWSEYAKNYDFTETYKTPKQKEKVNINRPFTFTNNSSIKYIIYGIGIAIILFLIGLLIKTIIKGVGEKVKKENQKVSFNNVENIEDADLDNLLNNALTDKRYKEAIRIRYLMLLRTLNRLSLIIWKKDKTNGTYINEMYGKNGFELFIQITIAFDRSWYGDKNISEMDYLQLIPHFDKINNIISTGE